MITNYLYKNIRWQFHQNSFARLLATPTTEEQFYQQLEKVANSYFPEVKSIDTLELEFCLNKIALCSAKTPAEKIALSYFRLFWARFTRLKNQFSKKFVTFPCSAGNTRVELVAELLAKCTQFAVDEASLTRMTERAAEITQLTEKEERYLADVVELYKLKYYCAATLGLLNNLPYSEQHIAKFLNPMLLKHEFTTNTVYTQAAYCAKQITTVIDCMGASAVKLNDKIVDVDTKLFVYANGRNVFDTFCKSKFGQRTAEFISTTKTVEVSMQYFIANNKEIRKITVVNKGKRARKFTVEIPLTNTNTSQQGNYFRMGNALCLATDVFTALAIVHDNTLLNCYGEQAQCFDVTVSSNSSFSFDVVTLYSTDTPTLADALYELETVGNTRCPYLYDSVCTRVHVSDTKLKLSSHGHVLKKPQKLLSEQLNYTCQLGDNDVATFVDNAGNSTTLLQGFVFGVRGEGIYAVKNGLISKLNEQNFHIDVDRLRYVKGSSTCEISHIKGKIYQITHAKPCKTLFYFPFEKRSKVVYDAKTETFTVTDSARKYFVKCVGKVESYTTNALECSEDKLRYKLSNNIDAGNCLAICLATSNEVKLEINSAQLTPLSTPIIRESLVSTYLNYVNDKSVFCLSNHLKRADCLSLAAICYTNPQFVRKYLNQTFETANYHTYYYDVKGKPKSFCDRLAFPLATIYYLNLVGELPSEMIKSANGVLFFENYEGKEICIKALALLKASQLNGFDKVRCLVEYNKLKKTITADAKLYSYAQAIGAVPMVNPSKERLKDLCNRYEIPKSWYYVSQLENLYGLNIAAGKLHIAPKVTAENVLEQFAININGKRIDTTFAKATVQSMTLNGILCFQPFCPQNLKNDENELVVRY